MHLGKSIVCVIPARLGSKRFPKKMLASLGGKPLLQCTYEAAKGVSLFDEVVVAVDSEELKEVVEGFGGKALLTQPTCQSGTDRLAELCATKALEADIWVNWQGDEPFITDKEIEILLQDLDGEIWTLKKKITKSDQLSSKDVVKVVTGVGGRALYFSRNPISGDKHIGIYAFSSEALKKIRALSPCEPELEERLEQLRFLYHGMEIQVHETEKEIFGIDTQEELAIAETYVVSSSLS